MNRPAKPQRKRRDAYNLPPDHVPPKPYAGICPLCRAVHHGASYRVLVTPGGAKVFGFICDDCFEGKEK